jgi:hypothetical protein
MFMAVTWEKGGNGTENDYFAILGHGAGFVMEKAARRRNGLPSGGKYSIS